MARIKNNPEQQSALDQVSDMLKEAAVINTMSAGLNDGAQALLSVSTGEARPPRLALSDKDLPAILSLLQGQRKRLAASTTQLAKKFNIELSDDDRAVLGISTGTDAD